MNIITFDFNFVKAVQQAAYHVAKCDNEYPVCRKGRVYRHRGKVLLHDLDTCAKAYYFHHINKFKYDEPGIVMIASWREKPGLIAQEYLWHSYDSNGEIVTSRIKPVIKDK